MSARKSAFFYGEIKEMTKLNKRLKENELEILAVKAKEARAAILKMTTLSASGHPGGSMSSIDFLLTLYKLINVDDTNPGLENRDRVVISHGHISPAVYTTLAFNGFFPLDDAISQFRLAGSIYEGHVEPDVPGVEWTSGNLGQGLSAAVGFALAARMKGIENNLFVLMGDGEQQKGQISEACRFAVKYGLKNITAFIDYNKLQIGGDLNTVMPQDIKGNYLSNGWDVIEIDGHNFAEIQSAIFDAADSENPTLILANTVMGKGVSFMENKEKFHGSTLSEEMLQQALEELGAENDFDRYKELRANAKFEHNKKNKKPTFDFDTGKPTTYTGKTDNRSAWGNAIADIAGKNPEKHIAVFDCDLQGSVKTNDFEKNMPSGFFQSGIMEHHTAVAAAALSKTGIQTFFADFGVFGVDETFNQHRLSDINETNLKIITTHVGLDVGEDGKTHQCIDYLGLMKNLYGFKTIIPGDPNQTDKVIRYITNEYGNFLIPMGRSKLDILKDDSEEIIFGDNYEFIYGKADKLREGTSAAMFVTGTLAGNALKIADRLKESGISLQVWNISCPNVLDEAALKEAVRTGNVFTYEDHNVNTGLGNSIADKLMQMGLMCKFVKFGVEDYALSGKSSDVYKHCKLDVESIVDRIRKVV
jgi:transketolase